jgi:hypoxanthine phosphoribosyltransferase
MSDATAPSAQIRQLLSAEQIQKRVKEMGRQISNDYRGQTIHVLGVLENSFLFMADLVRALEPPVVCTFIKPRYVERPGSPPIQEILFSHPFDIRDQHVLIVEGLVHSGVTAEFLMSNLRSRGAATVKSIGRWRGECRSSPTTSASWWMQRSWSATAWDRPPKPTAICLLLR